MIILSGPYLKKNNLIFKKARVTFPLFHKRNIIKYNELKNIIRSSFTEIQKTCKLFS